jgi:hypothetical protein
VHHHCRSGQPHLRPFDSSGRFVGKYRH